MLPRWPGPRVLLLGVPRSLQAPGCPQPRAALAACTKLPTPCSEHQDLGSLTELPPCSHLDTPSHSCQYLDIIFFFIYTLGLDPISPIYSLGQEPGSYLLVAGSG